MNDQQLQSLRNLGNECEEAADEIVRLRAALAAQGVPADLVRAAESIEAAVGTLADGLEGHLEALNSPLIALRAALAATPAPAQAQQAANWTDVRMELEAAGRDDLSRFVESATEPAQAQQAEGYVSQSALDWLADPMRGQRSCITTTIYRQPEGGSNTPIYIHAATKVEAEQNPDTADAERYRWLRDKSEPPHNFYLSVPVEFHGVHYQPHEVDAYIDAARRIGASSKENGNA